LPIELGASIQTHWPSYSEVLGINGGVEAGILPVVLDSQEGIEGPAEIFANCSYLVSTTQNGRDLGADAQTVHVLVDIREQLDAERRYRELFDTIRRGLSSAVGRAMVEANPALARMLGYSSQQELLDTNLFEDHVRTRRSADAC